MASYWQNLRKPLSNNLANTKMYSSSIINKAVKSVTSSSQGIHVSAKQEYPQAELLPMPVNIDPSENMRFSPQRVRDITSSAIATNIWNQRSIDITVDSSELNAKSYDPHVDSYDCTGAVSLNSSMQSNVPSPFGGMHKFTHLNMPGGQWSQSSKWMSHDLHSSHYTNLRREVRNNMSVDHSKQNAALNSATKGMIKFVCMPMMRSNCMKTSSVQSALINHTVMLSHLNATLNQTACRMYSNKKERDDKIIKQDEKEAQVEPSSQTEQLALTPTAKLKTAIKDYGSTVLVFHIAISLASLGIFYQLVSSGLDMVAIMEYLGLGSTSSTITSNVTSGASTFVVAYAIHKVFAPLRISITLLSAPFIVRYLRNKGILAVKSKKP